MIIERIKYNVVTMYDGGGLVYIYYLLIDARAAELQQALETDIYL